MKYKAIVIDVTDLQQQGRIKVSVPELGPSANALPLVLPCSPLAGPGFGFFCLPQVGDHVWVERTAGGQWVYTGFFWTASSPKPADGSSDTRVFRTPAGHQMSFTEAGDITISHSGGSMVTLKADGKVVIMAQGDIELNGNDGKVVTTKCICAYTGNPHPQGSTTVKAKGL